jgi:hypothetical protein
VVRLPEVVAVARAHAHIRPERHPPELPAAQLWRATGQPPPRRPHPGLTIGLAPNFMGLASLG